MPRAPETINTALDIVEVDSIHMETKGAVV